MSGFEKPVSDKIAMDASPGYCLNKMRPAKFMSQRYVVGGLYYCEFCGPIVETVDDPTRAHIFDPPPRLVAILDAAKGILGPKDNGELFDWMDKIRRGIEGRQ